MEYINDNETQEFITPRRKRWSLARSEYLAYLLL